MRPTEKDIQSTTSGYYRLACDGRHDYINHFYMYNTKREVITLWRADHEKEGSLK